MLVRRVCRAALFGLLLSSALVPLSSIIAPSTSFAEPQVSNLAVQAADLALKGNFADAGSLAARSGDPAAIKLVEMLYLKDHGKDAGYARIMDFLAAAPKWPITETLMKRAEQSLYEKNDAAQTILTHFADRKPVTVEGMLALTRANLATGADANARRYLRQAWSVTDLSVSMEKEIQREFGGLLSQDDHKHRLWRLVLAQESNAALRNSKRLSADHQRAATVAQGLLRFVAGSDKKYAALSSAMRNEVAMKYALARFYRKQENYGKARNILATVPGDATAMIDAEAFWTERRIIARRSIGIHNPGTAGAAYQIAKSHGIAKGNDAIEGEFLAGWIALRYLKKPDLGLKHFSKIAKLAESRTEKARAAYWSGRSFAAMGDKGNARAAYEDAAQYSTIYYGQLAREQIGLGKVPEEINSGKASAAAVARVEKDEVVRAFEMVARTKNKTSLYMFLWSLATRFKTVDEMNAVAAITHDAGGTTMALRLAKAAGQRNVDIDAWSYPLQGLPKWAQMGKPIEKAMVFGLSRQESEFDPQAGSIVGAQGLMQLMPGTAKIVAKQYRVPYAESKLKGDPAYNVKLGAAHLADLVEDFNGSYVLTLVAYNAGPRRSREWVEQYGDPRGGQVDPIDWVESIPFQETRQYVQKVMQNVHIYRSRLAPDTVRPMSADLKRGTPSTTSVASNQEPSVVSCGGLSIKSLISSCE